MTNNTDIRQRAADLTGIVFDVDGVLTDGRIIYSDDGHEFKQFHVQDGASLKLLHKNGIAVGVITGRRSPVVARRMRELGIDSVIQRAADKGAALDALIDDGFPAKHLAVVGDDVQDLAMFRHDSVSLRITVPNAHPEVLALADWVTARAGGEGVVVEIAQTVLQAQDKWVSALAALTR